MLAMLFYGKKTPLPFFGCHSRGQRSVHDEIYHSTKTNPVNLFSVPYFQQDSAFLERVKFWIQSYDPIYKDMQESDRLCRIFAKGLNTSISLQVMRRIKHIDKVDVQCPILIAVQSL